VPHFGPPMAPSMTASAFLAAVRASSVSGNPVASIEAWEELSVWGGGGVAWTLR
jgi:predicted S18 family serine protease